MGFRKRYALGPGRALIRRSDDAFSAYPPVEDRIPGQPSLDELKAVSISNLLAEGYSGTFETTLSVKAIRNVTIEISVTMQRQGGEALSVCTWKAGQGVSFKLLKILN